MNDIFTGIAKLLFFLFFVQFVPVVKAQDLNFVLQSEACAEEQIALKNISTGVFGYKWDFCIGDLESENISVNSYTEGNLSVPVGTSYLKHNNNWYAFIVNISNNTISRLDFGTSLRNTPIINNLGNLGNLLSQPQDIKAVKDKDSNIFLFVSNRLTNKLTRINLGTDINNSSPTTDILLSGDSDILNNGVEVVKDSNGWKVFYTTNNFLIVVNIGEELGAMPDITDIRQTPTIPGISRIGDISFDFEANSWFALVCGYNSRTVHRLDFGGDLFSDPFAEDITPVSLSSFIPYSIQIIEEGNNTYAFLSTFNGNLLRLDFENSLSNNPSFIDLGKFGELNRTLKNDFVKDSSRYFGITTNFAANRIITFEFPNDCFASTEFSKLESPSITYLQSGIYPICLTTYDSQGNPFSITKTITVTSDQAPSISLIQNTFCLTAPIQFTSESTSGGLSYTWDFGDGSPTSGDANPTYSYLTPGDYEVTLSVDDGTCGNFAQQTITIYNEPMPDFTIPGGNICTNQPYTFENSTLGDYGGLITYSWVLDGVPISSDQNLNITFSAGGTKELKLIAFIPGCDVEIAKNLADVKEGTLPIFSFDDSCVGEEVLFSNATTGDIIDQSWVFSNGFASTLESPTLAFDSDGNYEVTLNVTNADGCETFDTQTITIHALPVVDFSNELSCETLTTQFEDLSTVNIDNLSTWQWDFGDGSDFSTDQNASHIFNTDGDFEVELTATSSFGCVDSLTKIVTVLKAPEAAFDVDKICIDVPIQFIDNSSPVAGEELIGWSWNLGGVFSAQQNPQITFENALDYSVSLTVTSSNLCTSTIAQTLSVPPVPTVDFSLMDDCENETAQIADITSINGDEITGHSWLINDNEVSSDSNFDYDFQQAGNYDVTLAIITENGCEYESSSSITIHPVPTANFTTSFDFGAPPFIVEFTNQSTGAQSYYWTFEEGATSEDLNPQYTFESIGEFDISLVAISDQSCSDTTSSRIQVLEPILDAEVLNFNILPTASGDKLSFAIRNNGTIRLDSLSVTVDLGGELEIYESINQSLNPNEVVSAQLALTLDNRRLEYICIDIKPFILDYEDIDKDNNRGCLTFGQEAFIVSNPYPNPSSSTVTLDVIATQDAIASIEILSTAGDLISKLNAQVFEGNNKLTLDLHQLKSGVYFLKVKLDGESKAYRLVINN